jgi:site-specific recombinase XerD
MSRLDTALNEYLAIRRTLGFELREVAGCLRNFVTFLGAESTSHITTELALRWATRPAHAQPSTWAWRLGMVRRFAAWYKTVDPRTEIPPAGLLPHRYQRKKPHIYSAEEIKKILLQAAQLDSPKGLRAHTFTTLFGLLAVSGMRVNEAVNLDRGDVDLLHGILTIRRTKFGKSRHVPIHPSTVAELEQYARRRDRILPMTTAAFFVSERGTRITDCMARYTFAKLSQQLGLRSRAKGHGRGPRLHDMRQNAEFRKMPNHTLESAGSDWNGST